LWAVVNPDGLELIKGLDAIEFFKKSKLDIDVLKQIWTLCVPPNMLTINKKEFFTALRFISMFQSGETILSVDRLEATSQNSFKLPEFDGIIFDYAGTCAFVVYFVCMFMCVCVVTTDEAPPQPQTIRSSSGASVVSDITLSRTHSLSDTDDVSPNKDRFSISSVDFAPGSAGSRAGNRRLSRDVSTWEDDQQRIQHNRSQLEDRSAEIAKVSVRVREQTTHFCLDIAVVIFILLADV
jgi:hypothetical protein